MIKILFSFLNVSTLKQANTYVKDFCLKAKSKLLIDITLKNKFYFVETLFFLRAASTNKLASCSIKSGLCFILNQLFLATG